VRPLHDAYACLLANGLDGAGEALRILVNETSRIERAQHLQAMPYERSAQRVDQANGYKPKTMLTRMGEITFDVPQVRSGGFYPRALERGRRSEQSVNLALAEMYVQGTVFGLPAEHRVRMRATNGLERLNKEIKRRTRVATLFPNTASCLRLVSAILVEHDEEWMTAPIYLAMKP